MWQWFRNASAALQKQILQRQTEFGMQSVLPCFAGHVPQVQLAIATPSCLRPMSPCVRLQCQAITKAFPNANVTRSPVWNAFPEQYGGDYLLEPSDPAFEKIGAKLMEVLSEEFGQSEWCVWCALWTLCAMSHDREWARGAGTTATCTTKWTLAAATLHTSRRRDRWLSRPYRKATRKGSGSCRVGCSIRRSGAREGS